MRKNFRTMVLTAGLGAAACTLGLTGCSSPERSTGRAYEDWRINRHVNSALGDAPMYKFEDVKSDTFRGVVQLSGWVNSEDQRNWAAEIARTVPGVQEVINNISLKPTVDVEVTVPTPTGPDRSTNQPPASAFPPPTPPQ